MRSQIACNQSQFYSTPLIFQSTSFQADWRNLAVKALINSPEPQPSSGLQTGPASVSVVIVVWNAKQYVVECLDSLREHCKDICTEVIIVDNASSDGTPELIAQLFPEFKLIRNQENLGFAKANNIGIAHSTGEYVCLVNSDVKFLDDCISPMLSYFSEHPKVGVLGPRMLYPHGEVRRSTMRFPTLWNLFCRAVGLDIAFKRSRLFGGQLMGDFDHLRTAPVEVLNGWFMLIRRSAIERVGVLDPQFFMYGEDVDWCYRFYQAGEGIVFFAGSGAVHYGGGSSSKAPLRFSVEQCRANWQYWQKHHGWLSQKTFLGINALHHGLRLATASLVWALLPSKRAEMSDTMQRSFVCLRWVRRPDQGWHESESSENNAALAPPEPSYE